ncbi:capsule biosynthesis protein [Candidatus Gottesmanbacteria bacterium]|nr:capsule biosynthesis protein [Candidatus Gottesmanbacteria bacterium]
MVDIPIFPKLNRRGKNLHVDWLKIIAKNKSYWEDAKKRAKSPRVLIATSLGGYNHATVLESTLAVSLTLRGASVDILLCDKFLPACQMTKIAKIDPQKLVEKGQLNICDSCLSAGKKVFTPLGLPIHYYSELVGKKEQKQARANAYNVPLPHVDEYMYKHVALGEHAYAGTLRYFGRGDLEGERFGNDVLKRYIHAGFLSAYALQNLLKKKKYDIACFHHGIYIPQGIIGEICRREKVRIVNWNPAYRRHTFIFSHGDTYHHTMLEEKADVWKNLQLTPKLEKRLDTYLYSRRSGTSDWIWFHENPLEDVGKIEYNIGIDFKKPCIGVLTNVMWDARLHYNSVAFDNMIDWVLTTISYFSKRKSIQLLIRIHPAEIHGLVPSRQPLLSEIKKYYPHLASNIKIIPPESTISTYAVMEKCNAVIIYNTKTGIELSPLGIPMIVCGESWIRNKGFSIDVTSKKEYKKILDKLPFKKKLTDRQVNMAKKYAFHFFFRRMIPLPFIESKEKFTFTLNLEGLHDLLTGKYPGLTTMCDGILKGTPFVFPHEDL